jgi:hypothetical protein
VKFKDLVLKPLKSKYSFEFTRTLKFKACYHDEEEPRSVLRKIRALKRPLTAAERRDWGEARSTLRDCYWDTSTTVYPRYERNPAFRLNLPIRAERWNRS